MKNIIRFLCLLLCLCLAVSSLAACSKNDSNGERKTEVAEKDTRKDSKDSAKKKIHKGEEVYDSEFGKGYKVKFVGDDINGYIDLTEGEWINFQEAGSFSDPSIIASSQVISSSMSSIITMLTYTEDTDTEALAKASMDYFNNDGATGITGAKVSMGQAGYEAYQVYGYYPISETWFVVWYFKTEDSHTHYIAVEFPESEVYAQKLCEQYHFEKTLGDILTEENEDSTKKYIDESGKSGKSDDSDKSDSSAEDTNVDFMYCVTSLKDPAEEDEWVKTKTYCPVDSEYHTVYYKITNIVRGSKAQAAIDEYNKEDKLMKINDLDNNDIEYCYCDYQVYFPKDFPEREYGISTASLSFDICNSEGTGLFDGYFGLSTTWGISSTPNNFHAGDTYNGRFVFAMVKDYNNFYVKYSYYDNDQKVDSYVDPS